MELTTQFWLEPMDFDPGFAHVPEPPVSDNPYQTEVMAVY